MSMPRRHVRSYVRVPTHVQNFQHEQEITRAYITINHPIAHPNRNFVALTATRVTVTFCFHNSAVFCFTINETFDMSQQQETLCFRYTDFESHVHFQIREIARVDEGARANWCLCTNFFRHGLIFVWLLIKDVTWIVFLLHLLLGTHTFMQVAE